MIILKHIWMSQEIFPRRSPRKWWSPVPCDSASCWENSLSLMFLVGPTAESLQQLLLLLLWLLRLKAD